MESQEDPEAGPSSFSRQSENNSSWSRLRSGIETTAALRAAQRRQRRRRDAEAAAALEFDNDAVRVDDEGMGGEAVVSARGARRTGPLASVKSQQSGDSRADPGAQSWQFLTTLFSDTEQERRPKQANGRLNQSPVRAQTKSTSPRPKASDDKQSNAANTNKTVVEEPASFLDGDLSHLRPGQDPLAFLASKDPLDSDEDSDSDTDDVSPAIEARRTQRQKQPFWQRWYIALPFLDPVTKGVAKCVIAYFIASLFTYSPYLASIMAHSLPNHDPDALVPFSNLHMLATVAVYFHPARTFGSMLEADIFALVAFIFSMGLSMLSMLVARHLHDFGLASFSNFVTVFVFLGGGMAFVGWTKLTVGKPTFNTACSLVYVSTFTIMVREGSTHLGRFETDKIWQVSLVILTGTLVSNLVCFLCWPQRATTKLIDDMSRTLDAYATLLKLLTRTFLLEDPTNVHIRSSRLKAAVQAHQTTFTSLRRNLDEAKYEAAFDARLRGRSDLFEEAVSSLNRLGQHLSGLRSSCTVQSDILHKLQYNERTSNGSKAARKGLLADDTDHVPESQKDHFRQFLDTIGPHMRSLVFSCAQAFHALDTVDSKGGQRKNAEARDDELESTVFDDVEQHLSAALKRFEHEQSVSLKHAGTLEPFWDDRHNELHARKRSTPPTSRSALDNPSTWTAAQGASADDEAVLVIFFYIFNLEELAKELQKLVFIMKAMQSRKRQIARTTYAQWLRGNTFANQRQIRPTWMTRLKRLFSLNLPPLANFPEQRRHVFDTAQTPRPSTWQQRISHRLWKTGQFLRQPDIRFAIKAGFGCALLASPAFIHSTRPTFKRYQGQWALVSFMVVLSPTVGQSNQMSLHRLIGTIFGALVATGIYILFRDNNVILPILGALFSIPCFRYIVGKPHLASSGRFVLLTFNLTCLYAYNLRKTDLEAEHIGVQRTIAVAAGVIWATILNHLLWPNEARRELSVGISDLLSKMAWLYQTIVVSGPVTDSEHTQPGRASESQPLLASAEADSDSVQQMELYLRFRVIKLESLLSQTRHEPRLKGPFPVETYRQYLSRCSEILDKLHAMRCVTRRGDWNSLIQKDWIVPVNTHRREMVGNVILFLYLLASAMELKSPLPPYLPPAERSRQALLGAVRNLPVVKRGAVRGGTQHLLFYSYCLAMKDVIIQMEKLGEISQTTFGVIGGSVASFNQPFADVQDQDVESAALAATVEVEQANGRDER